MHEALRPVTRILVGIDGSEGAAAALSWATRVAVATGAEVLVVHVIERATDDVRPLGSRRQCSTRAIGATELEATWCEPLVAAGVRHRTLIESGRAGPRLVEIARHERADLVVTGRRGLTVLTELSQGSVSFFVTHHAPCAVAVVPAESGTLNPGRQLCPRARQPAPESPSRS